MSKKTGGIGLGKALVGPKRDVTVVYGANEQTMQFSGQTVGAIRKSLGQVLNIAPEAVAVIGGSKVNNQTPVKPGARVEFIKETGKNGC